jgi:cell division protein FtsB
VIRTELISQAERKLQNEDFEERIEDLESQNEDLTAQTTDLEAKNDEVTHIE